MMQPRKTPQERVREEWSLSKRNGPSVRRAATRSSKAVAGCSWHCARSRRTCASAGSSG